MKIDKIVKYLNSNTIMGNNINLCDSVFDIISLILWILLMMLLVTMCSGNKFMHRFLPIGFVESKWKYFLISFILAFVLIFFLLLVCTINEGEFFWIVNKNISTEWETWGGFATCLSAIFTLITVFYAYTAFTNSNRALKSQQKTAERASFDATFTQMFAQHNILYTKNRCLRHKHCHFAEFVEFFERMSVKQNISISKIWSKYNEVLDCGCGAGCSSNFKNYFKYIHRELTFIRGKIEAQNGVNGSSSCCSNRQYEANPMPAFLADSIKEYVRLIEGQMNNDELFCYFINQLDYYENHPNEEKELQWYFQYLIDMSFFKEICKDTYKYHNMVRRAVWIFMMNGGQHQKHLPIKLEWINYSE